MREKTLVPTEQADGTYLGNDGKIYRAQWPKKAIVAPRPTGIINPDILRAIQAERDRQDEKWGSNRSLPYDRWFLILSEEVGEVAKDMLEGNPTVEDELVQVAAVAIVWLEQIYRENSRDSVPPDQ